MSVCGVVVRTSGDRAFLWCPACADLHCVKVGAGGWAWDGDRESPTISPSILVTGVQWPEDHPYRKSQHKAAPGEATTCHSFVRDGQWQFLTDCTHTLAGQDVPCEPIPEGVFS